MYNDNVKPHEPFFPSGHLLSSIDSSIIQHASLTITSLLRRRPLSVEFVVVNLPLDIRLIIRVSTFSIR
jgi:hypothetical protein